MPKTNTQLSLEAIREQVGRDEPVTVAMLAALLNDMCSEGLADNPVWVGEGKLVPGGVGLDDGCLVLVPTPTRTTPTTDDTTGAWNAMHYGR